MLLHPGLKLGHKPRAALLAHRTPLLDIRAVDLALDLEQRIDALHRFKGQRRDHLRLVALGLAPGGGFDIGELEELAPAMRPASRLEDLTRRPDRSIELLIATIGVGLQDPAPPLQVISRMGATAIPRVVEQSRRRRRTAERSVVAHIDPAS